MKDTPELRPGGAASAAPEAPAKRPEQALRAVGRRRPSGRRVALTRRARVRRFFVEEAKAVQTPETLKAKKDRGEKIVMLTAYDAPSARLAEAAGVDLLLVGDSLGMVVLGFSSTVSVTLEMMVHHTQAVRRGAPETFTVADLPFLWAHEAPEAALRAAGRLIQEGGAHAVKLEGGAEVAPLVRRLVAAGIPVMGHLGLLPQTVLVTGGYRVRGKSAAEAERIVADARALVEAGAFSLVVEAVPESVGRSVARAVPVPVIGIGAGRFVDGQVLVYHDLLGYGVGRAPRFVKRYAELDAVIVGAIRAYADDVRSGRFPEAAHAYLPVEAVPGEAAGPGSDAGA
ncbi:MAG: 3-methyl-2-oxobutanoate hydroxymethyltransferase [Hydrogenibacillus schlegelii]|uniref:3-methyl-2-oxobutanoate hydroxymethyltransferase n=1 Tax=Hydrogenibacillus schlegelii TaxID=1484 RepID=A0A947GCZ3_HYDSH|nr:3-methyl-2-oxobutanoate hydroxymethyltransferase [Hydrogenibacillus schlegelii]